MLVAEVQGQILTLVLLEEMVEEGQLDLGQQIMEQQIVVVVEAQEFIILAHQ